MKKERVNNPTISKIFEGEVQNFKVSKSKFEDILTWAERVKEIVTTNNVRHLPIQEDYLDLLHIQGNSFITSIILLMKAHIFFAYAVARVGVEATIRMATIESNFTHHLKVWQDYNYNYQDRSSTDSKKAKKEFDRIFRAPKDKHDYSAILDEHEHTVLFKRWDDLCESGSHASFLQTIFSIDYTEIDKEYGVKSGIFDINADDSNHVGKYMVYLIDTFFLCAIISTRILDRHNVSLKRTLKDVESLWDEWLAFKLSKAQEFGFKPPEEL